MSDKFDEATQKELAAFVEKEQAQVCLFFFRPAISLFNFPPVTSGEAQRHDPDLDSNVLG
ncbi:hypothetical protein AX17_000824 [Amanita inopinata Kibby_2008]|nr:hypothetical protein AX17_000824 [Amanita inopinata Kibby_2008]